MSLQSDYARRMDKALAALASVGLISSISAGVATRQWRLTAAALDILEHA